MCAISADGIPLKFDIQDSQPSFYYYYLSCHGGEKNLSECYKSLQGNHCETAGALCKGKLVLQA